VLDRFLENACPEGGRESPRRKLLLIAVSVGQIDAAASILRHREVVLVDLGCGGG
jgi:hypothetical protein